MTTKTNIQEKVMVALENMGCTRVENLGRYWRMAHPERPEFFYFVGKRGGLRAGRTVSESISLTSEVPAVLDGRAYEAYHSHQRAKAANPTMPAQAKDSRDGTKHTAVLAMLRRQEGATIEEMVEATGWQAHSVRGFLSGALKKKAGLDLQSTKEDGRRVYRIA